MTHKLEDVMSPAEFDKAKQLANRLLQAFNDENGKFIPAKTVEIMLACAMVVAGFTHKDIDSVELLDSAKQFQARLFDAAVRAFKKDAGTKLNDLDPLTMAMLELAGRTSVKAS